MSKEKKDMELTPDQLEKVAGGRHQHAPAADSRAILAEGQNADKLAYELAHKPLVDAKLADGLASGLAGGLAGGLVDDLVDGQTEKLINPKGVSEQRP